MNRLVFFLCTVTAALVSFGIFTYHSDNANIRDLASKRQVYFTSTQLENLSELGGERIAEFRDSFKMGSWRCSDTLDSKSYFSDYLEAGLLIAKEEDCAGRRYSLWVSDAGNAFIVAIQNRVKEQILPWRGVPKFSDDQQFLIGQFSGATLLLFSQKFGSLLVRYPRTWAKHCTEKSKVPNFPLWPEFYEAGLVEVKEHKCAGGQFAVVATPKGRAISLAVYAGIETVLADFISEQAL